ncbi:extracellular solute-binding protein [Halobacillus halophilus]|uniref:ABC transporter substrate-binding protein n=1 Tax=Halobacillus halophilus TaxID=1570 RepID=UPI0013704F43|nr:ABC transporter substrate-binding protein [Halobacillus halophilus]MYL31594.1 extracellular solute-binding protein [Halobacillus halophilus]
MKKRVSLLGMTAVLVGGLLAGCSGGEASGNEEGQVEVKMSGWSASPEEQALLEETIADFEEKHPHIDVNFQTISDQYMDVLKTRLIGGEAADLFYLDASEAPALMSKGVLEPLNEYVTDDFDINDFEDPLLNAFKQGEEIYGFPKDFSTLALFYNKQAFEDAGLSGPPQTWEEVIEYSEKLTVDADGDGNPEQYGLGIAKELARQFYKLEPYGAELVDENGKASFASEQAVDALQPLVDQYREDQTAAFPSDVGAGWGGEMFGQGKAAMVIEGNWAVPFIENNFSNIDYGTSEIPTVNDQKVTAAFPVAYVMNKQSEKKEAAWELLSYLTGKEGMKTWTSKGFALPTRKSVAEELGYDSDEIRGSLVKGASYAQPWQAGENLSIIMNNFDNQFSSALLGEQSLDEALQKAQETANKEIEASN